MAIDYRQAARDAARRAGIDPARFERQIDQESGFAPDVIDCRRSSSAGARGIAQIVSSAHPGVDPCDPLAALEYAARWMADLLRRNGGSYARALASYNWGPGNVGGYTRADGTVVGPWDGRRETLPSETRQYLDVILGPGWEGQPAATPSPVAYDPTYPAIAQNDAWSCAPTALRWALHAFGRRPAEGWIEPAMIVAGVVSMDAGLLDASGRGLAAFVVREYGEFGYGAYHADPILFDDARSVAGRSPVLIGGRRWGEAGHWSGVRGYDALRDVLLLANPAEGYGGIGQTMSRREFERAGPFSMVVLTHAGVPATPEPADPTAALRERIAGLETALAHVVDVTLRTAVTGVALTESALAEADKIREQFIGRRPAA